MNRNFPDTGHWRSMETNIFQHMGLRFNAGDDGYYQTFAPLDERTGNHINTFHAAFQFALAEAIGGIVVFENRASERFIPLVKSVTMDFKKPATTDLTASAYFSSEQATEMNQVMAENGRYKFTLNIDIKNRDGEQVSLMKAVYVVRLAQP